LPTWAGIYAGSFVGAGFGTVKLRGLTSRTLSISGATGGALIGYNWETGRLVYGIEGDIGLNLIRGDDPGGFGLPPTRDDTLYSSRVRGRLGYDFGSFLPFIAGGVAMGELYVGSRPLTDFGQVRREVGPTVGAGVDWKFSAPILGPVVLRAEYLYETYPSATYNVGTPALPSLVRAKFGTSMVRVALISEGLDALSPNRPPGPVAVDWSGAYGGFLGGYGWSRARTVSPGFAPSNLPASGPIGGLYIGRNFAFGPWIVGIEGATALRDVTGTGAVPGAPIVKFRGNIEADTELRLGYAWGRFLPFFAAGAMFNRSVQRDVITGSFLGRVPDDAWTVGGGLDYRLADRWSLRGEYLYASSFKKQGIILNGCFCQQTIRTQVVRFGVAYHFD
jgi:outer membrane immunogenic protein